MGAFQNHLLRRWILYYFIKYSASTGHLTNYFTGTTIKHFTGQSLQKFPIPLCSKKEQAQIVRAIETRLSVCEKLEEDIVESLEKAKALRQSILKKAFAGELLTAAEIAECKKAADYEPAHLLLEKIKAGR